MPMRLQQDWAMIGFKREVKRAECRLENKQGRSRKMEDNRKEREEERRRKEG